MVVAKAVVRAVTVEVVGWTTRLHAADMIASGIPSKLGGGEGLARLMRWSAAGAASTLRLFFKNWVTVVVVRTVAVVVTVALLI